MTNQGICPEPECMAPEALGLPRSSHATSNGPKNAGLIGGFVGGFVGGGILVSILAFFFLRYKKKKNRIPIAFKRNIANNQNNRNITTGQEEEMIQSSRNSNALSGVIPIAFIPPTASRSQSSILNAERNTSALTFATATSQWQNDGLFQDNRLSNQTNLSGDISRRTSIDSHNEQVHTVAHAIQAVRAKPQIMRMNTIKLQNELNRSGPIKKELNPEKDDPFDDKNEASESRDVKPTDSVLSSADGEITIFWNGS